jgi:drug/metabolite transporter (DMT)-like permease
MNFMKTKINYHGYALITIFLWASAFVLTRITVRYFSIYSLAFLRYFIAAIALGIFAGFIRMKRPARRDIKWFFLSGFTGFVAYVLAFNIGANQLPTSTSSIIIATAPMLTVLLSRIINRETLAVHRWCAMALEFSGILVMTLYNGVFAINPGIFWMLLCAVLLSVYNLLQRRLTQTYSGIQACAYSIFAAAIMLAVFIPDTVADLQHPQLFPLLLVTIMGIFPSAIAYVTWSQALQRAPNTAYVSNYMFVTPFLASLMGFLIEGETPDLPTLVGGAIILAGIAVFNFGHRVLEK